MSEKEIFERLQELKDYKVMILNELKEAKIIIMYSNAALESVGIEEKILNKRLAEMQEVN